MASEYGLADTGYTTQSSFFDYDLDGDLDVYVLTNVIDTSQPSTYRKKITDGSAKNNDRLYRNDGRDSVGNFHFTNVTKAAGILFEGYGLGLAISDINLDGWPDIYVTNDYLTNDLLYINNRDGTFSNRLGDYLKHTCYSAMGNDVVDINNDGLVDIIALDMLPESNLRKKVMFGFSSYSTYLNNSRYGYEHQYARNVLQLNNGMSPEGHPSFSEISQLSGIHQTDWSWAPLVADFDNDGLRDIIITNGFPRDVTDHDFAMYRNGPEGMVTSKADMLEMIPSVKIPNYGFKNNGDLTFSDKTEAWGLSVSSFSNGAAYGDLDNDGDLDVVVNNINDSAFVFVNTLYSGNRKDRHFLRVNLSGLRSNREALGAKVTVYHGKNIQFYEHYVSRGYLSSVEDIAHFGLGADILVDSITVVWPDGNQQVLKNIKADQVLNVQYDSLKFQTIQKHTPVTFLKEIAHSVGVDYKHQEEDRVDFYLQRTLPHKFSQLGPGVAVGDIDNNGYDDFYVGGSANKKGVFFMQSSDGHFDADSSRFVGAGPGKPDEEMGMLFFDSDKDDDLDLYIVTGSYEFSDTSRFLSDKFYLNNGKGYFRQAFDRIPETLSNGSCVKAADFDRDGDLDLFVGGRVVPGRYPLPAASFILSNQGGQFVDVTGKICPALAQVGMISDALWSDYDNDGWIDLVIATEDGPVTFLKNSKGSFENRTPSSGVAGYVGWWNSLAGADIDNDGDIDYVAGNLGLNSRYKGSKRFPLTIYAADFDDNGSIDPIISVYGKGGDGVTRAYPIHTRDELIAQIAPFKRRFPTYKVYGSAPIDSVLKKDIERAKVIRCTWMASSVLENLGNGKFKITPLPNVAQFAPIYAMSVVDIDLDGNVDLLAVGNNYGTEVFTGRYDASVGLCMKGIGDGSFTSLPISRSGFFVDGDAKAMAQISLAHQGTGWIVTQNLDSVQLYAFKDQARTFRDRFITLRADDVYAEIDFMNGKRQHVEFYYGGSYLSQSTRQWPVPREFLSIRIYNSSGQHRTVNPEPITSITSADRRKEL